MQFFYSAISRTSFVYTKVTMLLLLLAGLLLQANSALAACGPYQNIVVVGTRDGVVWGSGPYGERSNFGAAAVHAGLIEPGETATIQRTAVGARTLVGTTQQGVTSTSYPLSMCAVTLSIAGTSNDNEDDPATDDGVGTNTGAGGASNGGAPVTIEQLLATIRSLQDQLAQMQGGGASGAAPGTSLAIGAAVRTTSNLNVRDIPATTGTLLGVEPAGTQGTITDGPTTANGYTWWKVRYTSGGHGWSVDAYLVRAGSSSGTAGSDGCAAGTHLASGRCVSNTRSCTLSLYPAIAHGYGEQTYANGSWGSCSVKCNEGYILNTEVRKSYVAGDKVGNPTGTRTVYLCEPDEDASDSESTTDTGSGTGATDSSSGSTSGGPAPVGMSCYSGNLYNNGSLSQSCPTAPNGGISCSSNMCAAQGYVWINGQQVKWQGNTSDYCYAHSACEANHECNKTSNRCQPKTEYYTEGNSNYKKTWNTGTNSWGSPVFLGCRGGNHESSPGTCTSSTRSCVTSGGANGTQVYIESTKSWGTCNFKSCPADTHEENGSCVSNSRSCEFKAPYGENGYGTQTWSSMGWGLCDLKCNDGYRLKETVTNSSGTGDQYFYRGIGETKWIETGSTAKRSCVSFPRTINLTAVNKKTTLGQQLEVTLSNAVNLNYCIATVRTNEGVTRQAYGGQVSSGTAQGVLAYSDLKLASVGGVIEATCFSDSIYGLPGKAFSVTYSAAP